ncbi:hypothetical protein PENANT_c007G06128 [Penicillium antarcticum]|uniref:Beta-galactosidase jelly roll domain-containing protein n=2 Tax=Penicillium antarcticum TaxID=416450 RepID=A0A1V6QCN6_9EURO|nr:hypothetical protein PENANT_c007G06128 [Penicillium antarcticum]
MSVVFGNSSQVDSASGRDNYRCQLFINGYQFGKYINNLGPQQAFPVPEGILNHEDGNFIALTVWAQGRLGAALGEFELVPTSVIKSGYSRPQPVPQPTWVQRKGAY